MALKDYYESLTNPKMELIARLAAQTDSSASTVYGWISGRIDPPMIKKRKISEILRIPIEELFPER